MEKKRKLPDNIVEVKHPDYVIDPKPVKKIETVTQDLSAYDNLLTLEDYKTVLSILKKDKEDKEIETIRKEEEITRKEEVVTRRKTERKMTELEMLYSNII